MRKLIDIVLYSSFFIALGGAALLLRSYWLMNVKVDWSIVLLVFSATLFTYNLTKVIPLIPRWNDPNLVSYGYNERNQWNALNKYFLLVLTLISGCISLYLSFELPWEVLLFLGHLGVISVLYASPVLRGKGLRTIPLLKIILISYVWAGLSVLPIYGEKSILDTSMMYLWLENFFFIFAITLPFDIRDFEHDIQQKVRTIPKTIGVIRAKYLALVLLALSSICTYFISTTEDFFWLNSLTNFIIVPLIYYASEDDGEYYYLGLIDGTILLRLVIFIM